ncbi:MAG: PLP-dependent aspartate aminotransferase family protein [Candidatus Caenarcaniphilales bacterium]|nr:PLP-dependent aspartate aminotransferase family protein [Candidatus Caenarcaniphilales bacterium]
MNIETSAIHNGIYKDTEYSSVSTPIYQTSTFSISELGEQKEFDYTRSGNPTRKALEENLAELENGYEAFSTSSGMSAITAVLSLLKTGDHLITSKEIYGGTYRLFSSIAPQFGIEVSFVDNLNDSEVLKKTIKSNTKMVWIETPSNPLLKIVDIKLVQKTVKEIDEKILLVSDNTFLSPYFQKPLDLGCDIVIHSTTKYINGHSDVIGGVVISKTQELSKKVQYYVNCMGLASAPFDSWLVLRGVKTLPLRMKAHEQNALKIANFLQNHELVEEVYYPGLQTHPQYDLIKKQMQGFGGMLSFKLNLEAEKMNEFFKSLKIFQAAVSLGGVESLIAQPWSMSHASMSEQDRLNAGVIPQLVRISAGVENSEDLINDLNQSLKSFCCCC